MGPGVPAFLTDPDNRYEPKPPFPGSILNRSAACPGAMAHQPGIPAGALAGARAGQPDLAAPFWPGVAATSDNLGYTGSPPSHPELLEFLADELVRSGWSTKALHRLILASSVYRQSSHATPEAARVDPDNRLLARFPLHGSTPRPSATPCSP